MVKIKVDKKVKATILKEKHDKALTMFIEAKGNVSTQSIATGVKVPKDKVDKWVKDEQWMEKYFERLDLSQETVEFISTAGEDYGLSEQEEMFCYHYLRTFNAVASALHAGYVPAEATAKGQQLLRTPAISHFLTAVKSQMSTESFVAANDVLQLYEKIAFADINDFVRVSRGTPQMKNDFDGQLVKSVKKGKDGVSFELLDKRWALDKLDMYHNVVPNKVAEETLKLQTARVEIERAKLGEEDTTNLVDGFEEAFQASVAQVWGTKETQEEEDDDTDTERDTTE